MAVSLVEPAEPSPPEPTPTVDAALLGEALESANIPALMMAMTHLYGDLRLLDGAVRPKPGGLLDQTGGIPDEETAKIRTEAARLIAAFFASGRAPPPLPPAEQLIRMMSFAVGLEVPDEYIPLLMEWLHPDPAGKVAMRWAPPPRPEQLERLSTVVIGAGESGLCAAIRLEKAGVPYTVFEKNQAVGGTWHENSYPGCRVDSPNHFYCYSFEPNNEWPEYYSTQGELEKYLNRCADKYDVRKNIRFGCEVTAAVWDEVSGRWRLTVREAGRERAVEAAVVISAVGQLNRPKIPDFPGLETFRGRVVHSAAWPADLDVEGQRVALVGSGASAMQLGPAIVDRTAAMLVVQRDASWIIGNPFYGKTVTSGKKWLMNHLPYYAQWYRLILFWMVADKLHPAIFADPSWPDQELSISAMSEQFRRQLMTYIEAEVGDDPELLARMTPQFPPFGKRILVDAGWFGMLKRDHVALASGVRELTADGLIDSDGRRHPLDVLICATGFHANRFLWPMRIEGRGGLSLAAFWGDDPRAYYGVMVPDLPNFFVLYGPNTNSGQGGSIFFNSECQMEYVMACLQELVTRDARTVEVTREGFEAYNAALDEKLERSVWAHPRVRSWYKNSAGRVITNSPWRTVEYWRMTRRPNFADFRFG